MCLLRKGGSQEIGELPAVTSIWCRLSVFLVLLLRAKFAWPIRDVKALEPGLYARRLNALWPLLHNARADFCLNHFRPFHHHHLSPNHPAHPSCCLERLQLQGDCIICLILEGIAVTMSTIPSKRSAPVDIAQKIAEARERAAAVKARLEAQRNGQNGASSTPPPAVNGASAPPKTAAESARERVEAMFVSASTSYRMTTNFDRKAKIAARTAKAGGDVPPARPAAQTSRYIPPPPPMQDFEDMSGPPAGIGSGLSIGIHPALLSEVKDRRQIQKSSWKGKREPEKVQEKVNPYLEDSGKPGGRAKRALNFTHNLHERPAMQAANEMRRKAALEAMKKRIAASTMKAGLEEATEIQAFAVPMPPDVEFWDEALESEIENSEAISALVLHPIQIAPPQEKFIQLKEQPLKLTVKEQKKMRRIRRAEEHREEQAKIRLGLVPTPAPKIKHSNVMRVYGEMAVKDPTAVEAMVNKQVAERLQRHEDENESRKLSKEDRLEKTKLKAKENAAMGLTMCVFKIALGKEKLHNKIRYKINQNANQLNDLSGRAIVSPAFTLIFTEAGDYSTRRYKKLLLNRIKYQAIVQGDGEVQNQDEEEDEDSKDRTATLLFEGSVRDRKFRKWVGIRDFEYDHLAKESLAEFQLDSFWTLAKSST